MYTTSCVTIIEVKMLNFLRNAKIISWELGIEICLAGNWDMAISLPGTLGMDTPVTPLIIQSNKKLRNER
jgi:hypothetical protein